MLIKQLGRGLVVAFALLGTGLAQNWYLFAPPTIPAGRVDHAMVYDSLRGVTVMFGGRDNGLMSSDVWEFDGVDWSVAAVVPGPTARFRHAMAFSDALGKVVLFGGSSGVLEADTWLFDGASWQLLSAANSPPARSGHTLVYDSARGVVVLHGGYGNGQTLQDTWEFDGASWSQVVTATTPETRREHAAVYDSARGVMVVYGGYGLSIFTEADTWEYDGVDWTSISTPTAPGPRKGLSMVFDSTNNVVLQHGGRVSSSPTGGTWSYDGSNWTQVWTTLHPGIRVDAAMTYDRVRDRAVLFGGQSSYPPVVNYRDQTWEFTSAAGTLGIATSYGAGCGATQNMQQTGELGGRPVLGKTATARIFHPSIVQSLTSVAIGWDDQVYGAVALPMSLASIGMPGCSLVHSADVFGLPVTLPLPYLMRFSVVIPNQSQLLGVHFYTQAFGVEAGANPRNVIVSNGVDWFIGDI